MNRTDFIVFPNVNASISRYDNQSSSTLPSSSSSESLSMTYEDLPLVERLTIYITLIVSIIGIIGNACTFIVLNSPSMRKWRSSILLSALAAVDFLYLLIIFLSIIDTLTNQALGFHRSLILCQTTVYITHICSFLSANFTLSFTLQRFVAVLFPLHANAVISSRSSIINILLLVFLGCSFYSFSFFLTNISHGVCKEDESYPALFPLLIVDTCLTFVLPFIFIVVFNCAIVYKLRMRKKFEHFLEGSLTGENSRSTRSSSLGTKWVSRKQSNDLYYERQRSATNRAENHRTVTPLLRANGKSDSIDQCTSDRPWSKYSVDRHVGSVRSSNRACHTDTPIPSKTPTQQRQGISQRTTKMLVICSTTFLLFNSPYCAVLLYSVISKDVLTRTLGILRYFYFMSFCLNFFLYSLCGHRFRHELILLVKKCFRKCCSHSIRTQWLRIDKLSPHQSFSRVPTRTGV